MKYTNETWIEKAKEKYGDRFDYSKTNYIDSYHKVDIICKKHNNTFTIDPITFIRKSTKGDFCDKCNTSKKLSNEEFIEIANINWGHKYDLSKVVFTTVREDVIINCHKHGEFTKQARRLSCSPGTINLCPKCIDEESLSTFDYVKLYSDNKELGQEDGVFYKLLVTHKPTNIKFIKIGITKYTTERRYKHSEYKDFEFEVIDEIFDTNLNVAKMEKEFKSNNTNNRFYIPNDINFRGRTECYKFDKTQQLKHSSIKFIRDSLLEKQNNICPICKRVIKLPTLDHYHSKLHNGSGLIRGVMCNTCNTLVGAIENSAIRNNIPLSDLPDVLKSIGNYVLNKREPYIHPNEVAKEPKLRKDCYNRLKKRYDGKSTFPSYPSSGKLTVGLKKLFDKYEIEPIFYS